MVGSETSSLFPGAEPGHRPVEPAPFLPMSREELEALGWDSCDVVIVTGDAYVDHPSFGAAIVGRLLEACGFRVGIIAQPDWRSAAAFEALGRPNLFFGITAGNMDSMVNRYTADGRLRSDDAYSPEGRGGMRPDRAVIVYAQRAREAFKGVPLVIGGIEASLRRFAHYDYWSDAVRRSILLDSRADLLLYGNAERALIEVARRVAAGEELKAIRDVRGTAFVRSPWTAGEGDEDEPVRLPDYETLAGDPVGLAEAARSIYLETNPHNACPLVQGHKDKDVWVNPPPVPLSTGELDSVFELPFARSPHPAYQGKRIPAWEMIRFSVSITRGCFGGCSFCSISLHEGRLVQSRSEESVAREIERVRDLTPGFTGVISDLGGPTANMYRLGCGDGAALSRCRRLSCLYPDICPRLKTDHRPLVELYRRTRKQPGIKKVLVASGLRHDLALLSPEYIEELVTHHVGGLLKLAPEHTEPGPLSMMMKPSIRSYERFAALFEEYSRRAGKVQHIVPYFIAAHPGTTDEDMLGLALWLKKMGLRVDQVQTFLPSPSTLSTAMYASGRNPLGGLRGGAKESVHIPKGARSRRLQKAFLRNHDSAEWPLLREALIAMGRSDLVGGGPGSLAPRGARAGRSGRGGPVRSR